MVPNLKFELGPGMADAIYPQSHQSDSDDPMVQEGLEWRLVSMNFLGFRPVEFQLQIPWVRDG